MVRLASTGNSRLNFDFDLRRIQVGNKPGPGTGIPVSTGPASSSNGG